MRLRLAVLTLGLCLFSPNLMRADAVGVSYTVSGSSGAWILDFSVTNNVNAGQDVYFFGVLLPTQDIVGSPTGFVNCASGCTTTTWNPSDHFGGPDLTYNNLWLNGHSTPVLFGNTLSGFDVGVSSAIAPTSVEWFAYAFDATPDLTSPYLGGENFSYTGDCIDTFGETCAQQDQFNPGFANVASEAAATATPEPSSLFLLTTGLLGLGPILRRRFSRG
jgi:hypothetical protein